MDSADGIGRAWKVENNNPFPTRHEYEQDDKNTLAYDEFVRQEQAKLAKAALSAAEKKAGDRIKVRVKGAFRPGQQFYMLPCKDNRPRWVEGAIVFEPPEPGIPLPVTGVHWVPVRDEAHRKLLLSDTNLEFPGDDVLTAEEEAAVTREVVERFQAGKKASAKK